MNIVFPLASFLSLCAASLAPKTTQTASLTLALAVIFAICLSLTARDWLRDFCES